MWVQQLEEIPFATAAPRDPKAVQRWAAEHVAPSDAALARSAAVDAARERRARAVVEARKADRKARAQERPCDRHFRVDRRPPQTAPAAAAAAAPAEKPPAQREPVAKKSQRDKVWPPWSAHVREADELLAAIKEKEQARRVKPEKVQAFRHALTAARSSERGCDVHEQYIIKWQRENAPAGLGESEVHGAASEAATHTPAAAAATKGDKWQEEVKAILYELRPSAPASVKARRRQHAGMRRLAEARLHSPAARLLTSDARLELATSVLYSLGGWPEKQEAASALEEAQRTARELVRESHQGVSGDAKAVSH